MNKPKYGIKSYSRPDEAKSGFIVAQTVALLVAYVSRNAVPPADLPKVISEIHGALCALQNDTAQAPALDQPTRFCIAASIRNDRLVSFLDGKAYKSLKRHLTAHGMTPSEIPQSVWPASDYPMVSPGYAKLRSRIALEIRTGFRGGLSDVVSQRCLLTDRTGSRLGPLRCSTVHPFDD